MRRAIGIGAGATLERTVVLTIAGVTQSMTIAASPIEARSSGLETRFDSDYLANIPTRRFSMFDLILEHARRSADLPVERHGQHRLRLRVGREREHVPDRRHQLHVPVRGRLGAEPNVDVIQEVHVQSMGASVEYGNLQGAVFNVVTKQGGDRFQSDASYYGQFSGMTSQPVVLPVSKGTVASSGTARSLS